MAIAVGVAKKLTFKKQSGLGVVAPGGAATGQAMRRVTSTIDLAKATYKSTEILPSMQRRDYRHGVRSVAGTINGELSVGTHQSFFESLLRQLAQAASSTGALTNVTAAVTTGAAGTFTRAAGSFLTDGFKIGHVMQWTGWATTGVPNNTHNFMITALTPTVMTVLALDGVAVGPKASGDSVTGATVGKSTWIPATGQTRDYYSIEHFFSDISQSDLFTDCVITDGKLNLPATGMATADFSVMGLNVTTNTAAYFTSPTAASTGGILAAVNGVLIVSGVAVGLITGLSFDIHGNYSAPGGVVGSNVDPDIFPGSIDVTGQATVYFQDGTYRDMFLNETIASIAVALTADNTASAGVVAFVMSKVKFGGATKDDGEKGLLLTMPFTALENTSGGAALANLATTISIQDSAWV